MISGYIIIAIVAVLLIIISLISVFCYCYGDNTIKYIGYSPQENSSEKGKRPGYQKQCSCSESFKGLCEECETPEFVNDGELGKIPDFSGYGGHLGLDSLGIGPTSIQDPTRSFMGKSLNPWSGPKPGTIKTELSAHFV